MRNEKYRKIYYPLTPLLNHIVNCNLDTSKVSHNDFVYSVYQTQNTLNNEEQTKQTKSTLCMQKTKRVNRGFVPYGGDRDTKFSHANNSEWI